MLGNPTLLKHLKLNKVHVSAFGHFAIVKALIELVIEKVIYVLMVGKEPVKDEMEWDCSRLDFRKKTPPLGNSQRSADANVN